MTNPQTPTEPGPKCLACGDRGYIESDSSLNVRRRPCPECRQFPAATPAPAAPVEAAAKEPIKLRCMIQEVNSVSGLPMWRHSSTNGDLRAAIDDGWMDVNGWEPVMRSCDQSEVRHFSPPAPEGELPRVDGRRPTIIKGRDGWFIADALRNGEPPYLSEGRQGWCYPQNSMDVFTFRFPTREAAVEFIRQHAAQPVSPAAPAEQGDDEDEDMADSIASLNDPEPSITLQEFGDRHGLSTSAPAQEEGQSERKQQLEFPRSYYERQAAKQQQTINELREQLAAAEKRIETARQFVSENHSYLIARDDHSQNCKWCRLEKLLTVETKGAQA